MFEKTTDFKDFFPGFIDEDTKRRETRQVVEEISQLFDTSQLFDLHMVHKLTRLIRQLSQFEDLVFIRFVRRSERVRIIQNIWSIMGNEHVTVSTKTRFANILASHINCYKKLYLRPWWHGEFVSQIDLEEKASAAGGFKCRCEDDVLERQGRVRDANCICGLIDVGCIVDQIEEEFARDYLDGLTTNAQKVKNYVSSLARVLNAFRPYILEEELEIFMNKWLSLSTKSFPFFVYSKLFVLVCGPYCSYKLLESGRIFDIWGIMNGQFVSQWDSLMMEVVSRGVRYSWKTGKSLDALYKKVPYLFEILYINLGVPILHNVVSNSLNTGATSSTSSVSSGAPSSQVLQTKVPSVVKEAISNELFSALTVKPVNIFNKFAIVFVHLMKSLNCLQCTEEQEEQRSLVENVKVIPNSLINLVNIVYPLNHPSNIGKWSHGISIFVQALTYQFCKRIYRERVFIKSEKMSEAEKESIGRASLCRFDDEYLMSILFPLMEQGIYSKDIQVAGRYEDSLKRWTYILPDILLSFLLNVKIMPALEGDTETHQVYIAFRILATVVPLVIQFLPHELPKFLQISLQGIDISDPMKINQTLFFLTVFFCNLQNFHVKTLDFDEYETMEKLSVLMQQDEDRTKGEEMTAAYGLRNYFSLYNYPKSSIPISDKSLRNRKDLPKAILDQTDINGKSPFELYFESPGTEWEGDFELMADEEAKRSFYFVLYGKFDRETLMEKLEQRKVLLDSIFGYWIMECLERILNLLGNVVKPSETGGYSSSVDLGISYALRALIIGIFSKCREFGYNQLLRDCYEMIGNWICRNYIPDNYKHLSKILSAMGSCDPELSFEMILSRLLLKIGAGSKYGRLASKEALSPQDPESLPSKFINSAGDLQSEDESFILYYTNLVSSLIRYTQDHLLLKENRAYYFGVYSLIVELLLDSRRKVKRAGIKLEQRFMESITQIQITEPGNSRQVVPTAKSPEQIAKGIILWGIPFYLQEQSVFSEVQKPIWFVPERMCLLEVKLLVIFNYLLVIKLLKRQVSVESADFPGLLDSLFQQYLSLFEASISSFGEAEQGGDDLQEPRQYSMANFRVLLNMIKSEDEDDGNCSRQSSTCSKPASNDFMGSIFFCLNNIRILSKVSSYIIPIARNEHSSYHSSAFEKKTGPGSSQAEKKDDSILDKNQQIIPVLTLNRENFKEFEPFFSRYYLDTHRLILSLVEVFLGVRMLQVAIEEGEGEGEGEEGEEGEGGEGGEEGGSNRKSNRGNSTSCYYRLSNPLFKITSAEEIRFKSKVINTINQCLNRYYSSSSNLSLSSLYNVDFSDSVLAWLSYTNGLYYQSALLCSPRIFWLKNIQYYWSKRINARRHEYGFFGYRRKLVLLITLFSLGNYNLVRKTAQSALKDCTNSHVYSRSSIFQFILFEVYFSIFLYIGGGRHSQLAVGSSSSSQGQEDGEEGVRGGETFEQVLRSNVEYVRSAFEAASSSSFSVSDARRKEDPAEEFLFNHLSGLSYIIASSSSYYRFMWSNLSLLVNFIIITSYSSSFKLSKENIPVRILSALNNVVGGRDFDGLLSQYLAGSRGREEGGGYGGCCSVRLTRSGLEAKLSKLVSLFGGDVAATSSSLSTEETQQLRELEIISRVNSMSGLAGAGSIDRTASIVVGIAEALVRDLSGMRSRELSTSHSLLRRSFVYLLFVHGVILELLSSSLEQSEALREQFKGVIFEYWRYLWGVFLEMDKSSNCSFYCVVFFNLTSLAKLLFEKNMALLSELITPTKFGGGDGKGSELSDFFTNGDKIRSLLESMASIRVYYHRITPEHGSSSCSGHGGVIVGGGGGGSSFSSKTDKKIMNSTNTSAITNCLVLNYAYIMGTFPYHRFKCYSNNLSLVSVMFFQRIFFMLRMRSSGEMVEVMLDTLWDWSMNSVMNLEKEKHFLTLEVLASLISASTISSEMDSFLSDRKFVNREKLVQILRHEFQQSDQDFIFNFMDFIKHSLTPLARQDVRFYYSSASAKNTNTTLRRLVLDFVLNPFEKNSKSEKGDNDHHSSPDPTSGSDIEAVLKEENDLSTFEMIKYLRVYQSALMELVMDNDCEGVGVGGISSELKGFLCKGFKIFSLIIQKENNYKQLREEMSNMLHSLVVAGSLAYLGPAGWWCLGDETCVSEDSFRTSLVGACGSIVTGLLEELDGYLLALRRDGGGAQEEGTQAATPDLCVLVSKAEVVLYYCLLRDLYSSGGRSRLSIEEMIPFDGLFGLLGRLQLVNTSKDDILGLSYGSLMLLLISQLNHTDVPIMARLERIVNGTEKEGDEKLDPSSNKSRLFRIRVNTIIGEFYSPLLSGTKLQLDVLNNTIVLGLFEEQSSEIRHTSKLALCTLFRTLSSSVCVTYIQLFKLWVGKAAAAPLGADKDMEARLMRKVGLSLSSLSGLGPSPPRDCEDGALLPARTSERFGKAGVLGLVSAILSHPYDVPFWLPETITFLASCSGARNVSQVLKKQVQECIQEFFKTHQDGWNFIHKHKFSSGQLEVLDTYKGRPTYFT